MNNDGEEESKKVRKTVTKRREEGVGLLYETGMGQLELKYTAVWKTTTLFCHFRFYS